MANDNELLIKINADAKNFKKALNDSQAQVEDLDSTLNSLAAASGVAFAAFTAEIGLSVAAFAESQAAANELNNVLQTQGVFSERLVQNYKDIADAISLKTGVDDDQITSSQAVLQRYLGELEITEDLTQAVVDFAAAKKIDLASAAELVGKSIGTETNALARQGLQLDETATEAEKLARVQDFLASKFNGTAEAANQGLGGIKGLGTAFGNLQEAIGERFAPIIEVAISGLTKFLQFLTKSPEILNFATAVIAAGAAVSGIVLAITAGIKAFLFFKSVLAAVGVTSIATGTALRALVGATGLGLLIIVVTEIALHWNTIFPRLQKVFLAFAENIAKVGENLSDILLGIFTLDKDKIFAGFAGLKETVKKGFAEATADIPPIKPVVQVQDPKRSQAAKKPEPLGPSEKELTKERARTADSISGVLKDLQNGAAGAASALAEGAGFISDTFLPGTGKAVQQIFSVLAQGPDAVRAQITAFTDAIPGILVNIISAIPAVIDSLIEALPKLVDALIKAVPDIVISLVNSIPTLIFALIEAIPQLILVLVEGVPALIQALVDGVPAVIQQMVDDLPKVINEFTKRVPDIIQRLAEESPKIITAISLQTPLIISSLVAQIPFLIQTMQFELIKAIPSIVATFAVEFLKIPQRFAEELLKSLSGGGAVGGAAKSIGGIFGFAEGGVIGAAAGALLTGGTPGVDSIPVLGQEGELVTPAKNFEEVVGGVQNMRNNKDTEILAVLQQILAKPSSGGQTININGDVLADQNYINMLIEKVRDTLEFSNGSITPATGTAAV